MWEIFAKSLRKILKNLLARFLSRRHVNYMQDFGQKISLATCLFGSVGKIEVWGLDPLQCQWLLFITILS